ncbi:hypothetical protein Barb6XT_00101 [Bacteroidales bacterium Barb6XT]|nr:hypothetical protein Barb6XT_00101 [Bacteroidales bacterium Barb6XT]
MSATGMTFDASKVKKMLDEMSDAEAKKVMRSVLRSSAKILVDKTEEEFKKWTSPETGKKIGYAKPLVTHHIRKKGKNKGKQYEKVRRVARAAMVKGKQEIMVNIMNDYRVKWFEMGTTERYVRSRADKKKQKLSLKTLIKRTGWSHTKAVLTGGYIGRGKITGSHFFKKAQEETKSQIFDNMVQRMSKAIARVAKKYGIKVTVTN